VPLSSYSNSRSRPYVSLNPRSSCGPAEVSLLPRGVSCLSSSPSLLLFALNLSCRLAAVTDALFGMVSSDLLHLLPFSETPPRALCGQLEVSRVPPVAVHITDTGTKKMSGRPSPISWVRSILHTPPRVRQLRPWLQISEKAKLATLPLFRATYDYCWSRCEDGFCRFVLWWPWQESRSFVMTTFVTLQVREDLVTLPACPSRGRRPLCTTLDRRSLSYDATNKVPRPAGTGLDPTLHY
jgi:hypothetical protein